MTYPGCDIAGRLRAPRRGAAAAEPVEGAVCGAAVRCLLDLRGGDGAVGWFGVSDCLSRRTGALRFREAGPAAIFEGAPGSVEGRGSVVVLAVERVILDDMRS